MKKVLMVCESFGGGVYTYVSQLCNDMCTDFDVYLAYSKRPQTPDDFKKNLDSRVHLVEVKNFGNVMNVVSDIKVIKELRKIEKDIKPDIIHLHSSIAGVIGRIAFNGGSSKLVYTPHGYSFVLLGNGIKSKLYYMVEKLFGHISNSIILTCTESEDEVSKKLSKRTAYIETGVNLKQLSSTLDNVKKNSNKRFTVFTLGRVATQKQPQVFNRIAELVPEADFVWIGNGELENELTAPNVRMTGWKPRLEALSMAKSADVFILCSLGEAISMSLIENMYIKKLCLVSNTMGNKSVINSGVNGYICENPQDYAEKIKKAMKKFPSTVTDRAYQDVLDTYNTNQMKKKYISFYNGL